MTVSRLMMDIQKMFGERLRTLITDCGDTASRAGLDADDVSRLLITGLLTEVVIGTLTIEVEEDDYLRVCAAARRRLIAVMKKQARKKP